MEHTYQPQRYHNHYHDQQDDNNCIVSIIVFINFFGDIGVTDLDVAASLAAVLQLPHITTIQ